MIDFFDRLPGPIQRIGLCLLIPLVIIAYAVAFIVGLVIAVAGFPIAFVWWIATGIWKSPVFLLNWLLYE